MTDQTLEQAERPPAEPWSTAVRAVMGQFRAYAAKRMTTGDTEVCRRAAQVSEATAAEFETAMDEFCPDEDEAAPADATAETASELAQQSA